MNRFTPLMLLAAPLLLVACKTAHHEDRAPVNTVMVTTFYDDMARNAVLAQRTIFPYHFHPHSPELQEIGQRDLAELARHFRQHGGVLTLQQGHAPDELYRARVQSVRQSLLDAGVAADRIEIVDGPPDGPGMPSRRVILALERELRAPAAPNRTAQPINRPATQR